MPCRSCKQLQEKNKALSLIIESKQELIAALLKIIECLKNKHNEKN